MTSEKSMKPKWNHSGDWKTSSHDKLRRGKKVYTLLKRRIILEISRLQEIQDGRHPLGDEGEDFCDAYYLEMMKQQKENPKSGFKWVEPHLHISSLIAWVREILFQKSSHVTENNFSKESLIVGILDLWIAGQETTSLTLCWAMIYLLNNPHVSLKSN